MIPSKAPKGLFQLGLIVSFSLVLVAFEWTQTEWDEPAGWAYSNNNLLEAEMVPVQLPAKPTPPVRAIGIAPEINPEPLPKPAPQPITDPHFDPLEGQLFELGFVDEGGEEEIETLLIAEHMPHFNGCENVLDRSLERACTEAEMIAIIQRCAQFPKNLRSRAISGVVYLQFNIDEYGEVSRQKVLKGAHPSFNQSALSALDCIPKMIPGTQQGQPVRVTYTIPVRFTIR